MIKEITFIILLALTASVGFAQQDKIPFERYNVAEGLPEEFIRGLLQDDQGFIWAGTQNGLVKYDGYDFKVFQSSSDSTDASSLQSRNLGGGLLKTRDGKIWMGETSGRGNISSYDPLTEKFRNFYPTSNITSGNDKDATILLFEDEEGYIWFKTGSFLTGLRGKFTTFRLNPATGEMKEYPIGDINQANIFVTKLGTVESANTVWLLDDKSNLHKWDRQKDRFELIIPAGKTLSSSGESDTLKQLVKGSGDRLLLTGEHGLYIFDAKTQEIAKSYVNKVDDPNCIADSIFRAQEDAKGQIWLAHRGGKLSLIDPVTDNIQSFIYGRGPLYFEKGPQEIRAFFPGYQNKEGIWFQAWGISFGVKFLVHYQFDSKTFSIYDHNFNHTTNPLLKDRIPYLFLEDHTGLLWLGTRPGLYKQAPKKQQMDLFSYRANEPNGLPSDSIKYIFEDSKQRLWIGTRDGLALYQPDQDNFRVFRNDPANAASLSNNNVYTVQEDADGKIWVGTANGLNQWQESTGRFKRLFYKTGETNTIEFLFPDKQQRLWLSIWNKGVFILDKNTGRVLKSYLPDDKNPSFLTSNQIDVFYQDSEGTIWLGDAGDNAFGLFKLNRAEDGFTHYMPIPNDSSSISSNEIRFLAEDGKQRLWIGTDGGLNLYHYDQDRFTRFMSSDLSSVNYFTTDKDGEPWFATYSSGGLVTVNSEKTIITAYGESKGLLQNDIVPGLNGLMAKDNYGRFWLPTQRGLSVFDPETKSFISYFEKDGFQPYDRSYRAIKTNNGDIWIGSNNGLNHIMPASLLKKDSTLPSIVITQVTINDSLYSKPDGTVFKQSVAYTDAITVKYWQKDLGFGFVALHYLRSEDNLYSWKLENYDKDWSSPSKERKTSYTNLSPGTYTFRVRAANADGVWNEEGRSLTIVILPPWWKTGWAYLGYGLLVLVGLYFVDRYQRQRILQKEYQKAMERELAQAKEIEKAYAKLGAAHEHLKSTQSQLIQSEKMASLGELTAGIAHEIQNPLNFVNNFSEVNLELIEEADQEYEKGNHSHVKTLLNDIRGNEQKISHHGKRADGIVKSMLQHSRSSNGQKEPTDINALADEYLRLAYHGLRAKDKSFNADFKLEADKNLPIINVVPQDIGRVMLNLINNAFYAVDERRKKGEPGYEPYVSITTKLTANSQLQIAIKDNGNGIPEHIKDKIFQPFFTTKPTGHGTGLGLSMSYDIITKGHGGELNVNSHGNEGAEFIMQLPIN